MLSIFLSGNACLLPSAEQIQQNCHQELQTLAGQDFACVADAIAAAEKLSAKMKWHQLSHIQTLEKTHYA